jgi:hypothetical protein
MMMRRQDTAWALIFVIAAAVPCAAQSGEGEISGRITDSSTAVLPGVRIVISGDGERREAVTDSNGRFTLRGLKIGTYLVSVELPGFTTKSGTITLSPATRRARIAWPLTVGCLEEDIRVIPTARGAAAEADAIAQVRVTSDDGPLLISRLPECAGSVSRTYTAEVLNAVVWRGRDVQGRASLEILRRSNEVLKPGEEYVVILWQSGAATDGLVFPIVSGRVSSPSEEALHGMRIEDALKILSQWSRERPR